VPATAPHVGPHPPAAAISPCPPPLGVPAPARPPAPAASAAVIPALVPLPPARAPPAPVPAWLFPATPPAPLTLLAEATGPLQARVSRLVTTSRRLDITENEGCREPSASLTGMRSLLQHSVRLSPRRSNRCRYLAFFSAFMRLACGAEPRSRGRGEASRGELSVRRSKFALREETVDAGRPNPSE
jgi:hypothetical protein